MDILIFLNIIFFFAAFVYVLRRTRLADPRLWLRIPALFICVWYVFVYSLALFGIIQEDEIKFFLRWFHLVMAAYIVLEAKYG